MYGRNLCVGLALLAVMVSARVPECTTCCQARDQSGSVEEPCVVNLTSVRSRDSPGEYSECVSIHFWIKTDDICNPLKIKVDNIIRKKIWPITHPPKCLKRKKDGSRVWCDNNVVTPDNATVLPHINTSLVLWELVHHCVPAKANSNVAVIYKSPSQRCRAEYRVPDPKPDYDVAVDLSSKSLTVTVEPGEKVRARLSYEKIQHSTDNIYMAKEHSSLTIIDPAQSRSARLDIPYLLPCLCVEVFYTHVDAVRNIKCPFKNLNLTDVSDVWLTSHVELYETSLTWKAACSASQLKISASLCWRQHEHLCTPVPNSTLQELNNGHHFTYPTSGMDRHPQMCVQFSIQDSQNISCPFRPDMSSWEVDVGLASQALLLYVSSSSAAEFSAQLCDLHQDGCEPMGEVRSVNKTDGNTAQLRMHVAPQFLIQKPCVQVWRSHPVLLGKRILCPDYSHNRCGILAVAALIFVVIATLLGVFIHRISKSGAAGWLCIQKPVLLVCSSEQWAHISAACTLASILQDELNATVHTALWALSSHKQAGTGTGVPDVGPLPWLYGQWETVLKAQGKVLIVWSPEAKKTYEQWRDEREAVGRHEEVGSRVGKCKKVKAAGEKDVDIDWCAQNEPCTVIKPVFTAALACLLGALQTGKGQGGVALVYFQGLCHSRDIPKAFRGVARYCLPQDFRGLIQELGGMRRQTEGEGRLSGRCWPRLLTKVQSVWLARQLARRLQTRLPPTLGKRTQVPRVTSASRTMPDKTPNRLRFPEQEPLKLPAQVSHV